MKQALGLMAVAAVLAACNDRSAETVDAPGGGGTVVPPSGAAASLGDVDTATYDAENDVVTVVVRLDGQDTIQEYVRSGDVNGYARFDQQETPINRAFTAIGATSSDNDELVAVVTMDGGQFNRFFGGAVLEQGDFSAPSSGFAYFDGDYAGLVNIGQPVSPPAPPGTPSAAIPSGVSVVTGSVYMIADFTDNATEGTIYGRVLGEGGGAVELDDVVLVNTGIATDGTFNGTAEMLDLTGVGTYSGAFGGDDATFAGGIVALGAGAYAGVFPDSVDTTNLQEYGLFVIDQCDPASCFTLPPPPP
ncbi:hypothetical protein [Yoonia algicola]|uniref:Thymidylate synthase n=1 Tax=Yoonia algicola TaxID=3137368 RepID=A0AAN0NII5_9RHOB